MSMEDEHQEAANRFCTPERVPSTSTSACLQQPQDSAAPPSGHDKGETATAARITAGSSSAWPRASANLGDAWGVLIERSEVQQKQSGLHNELWMGTPGRSEGRLSLARKEEQQWHDSCIGGAKDVLAATRRLVSRISPRRGGTELEGTVPRISDVTEKRPDLSPATRAFFDSLNGQDKEDCPTRPSGSSSPLRLSVDKDTPTPGVAEGCLLGMQRSAEPTYSHTVDVCPLPVDGTARSQCSFSPPHSAKLVTGHKHNEGSKDNSGLPATNEKVGMSDGRLVWCSPSSAASGIGAEPCVSSLLGALAADMEARMEAMQAKILMHVDKRCLELFPSVDRTDELAQRIAQQLASTQGGSGATASHRRRSRSCSGVSPRDLARTSFGRNDYAAASQQEVRVIVEIQPSVKPAEMSQIPQAPVVHESNVPDPLRESMLQRLESIVNALGRNADRINHIESIIGAMFTKDANGNDSESLRTLAQELSLVGVMPIHTNVQELQAQVNCLFLQLGEATQCSSHGSHQGDQLSCSVAGPLSLLRNSLQDQQNCAHLQGAASSVETIAAPTALNDGAFVPPDSLPRSTDSALIREPTPAVTRGPKDNIVQIGLPASPRIVRFASGTTLSSPGKVTRSLSPHFPVHSATWNLPGHESLQGVIGPDGNRTASPPPMRLGAQAHVTANVQHAAFAGLLSSPQKPQGQPAIRSVPGHVSPSMLSVAHGAMSNNPSPPRSVAPGSAGFVARSCIGQVPPLPFGAVAPPKQWSFGLSGKRFAARGGS